MHAGRSQQAPEEVDRICQIWQSLQGQRWRDRHGKTRKIAAEDVLVVAPYNLQVNALIDALPAGARVGTIDKFQG